MIGASQRFLTMVVQFNGRISQNQNVYCRMEINSKNQISVSIRRWWFDSIYHRNRKTHSNFFIYKNWVLCFFYVFRKLSGCHLNGCRILRNRLYIFRAKKTNMNYIIIVVGDLNAAINILKRYEQNHIALLTAPLDTSNVVNKYNLLTNICS